MKKYRIGIIGGGNFGSLLSVKFSIDNYVTLYVKEVENIHLYSSSMQVYQEDTDSYYKGNIDVITDDINVLVNNSDYIFITYPAFLFPPLADKLIPLLNKNHHLIFIPGSGGVEFFFKEAINKGITITGLQRVHCVARIMDKGKLVKESGIRDHINIASIPSSYNKEACRFLNEIYHLPTEDIGAYLNITLINSNPILHTSRLYSIFKDYPSKIKEYDELPLFYEDWDIPSSELLIKLDKELFILIDAFKKYGYDINHITHILDHYESHDGISLANKIRSINSLKGLKTPALINEHNKYIPDLENRYFKADFDFGLQILVSISRNMNINNVEMEKVYDWYLSMKKEDEKSILDLKHIDMLNLYR